MALFYPTWGSSDSAIVCPAAAPSWRGARRGLWSPTIPAQSFVFTPIGVVRSPFTEPGGTPVQPVGAATVTAEVVVEEAFADGLADLDGFSHIYLLYVFHRAGPMRLSVVPFLDTVARGVFATRAPVRPNPIGLSLTRLVGRSGPVLHICGVDMLDGTPVLDIKPYIPTLDPGKDVRLGWLEGKADAWGRRTADGRFGQDDR